MIRRWLCGLGFHKWEATVTDHWNEYLETFDVLYVCQRTWSHGKICGKRRVEHG